jgi:hypothetical protein
MKGLRAGLALKVIYGKFQLSAIIQSDNMASVSSCEPTKKFIDLEHSSEIHEGTAVVYGVSASSNCKVKFWSKLLKNDESPLNRILTMDEPWNKLNNIFKKVQNLIL